VILVCLLVLIDFCIEGLFGSIKCVLLMDCL